MSGEIQARQMILSPVQSGGIDLEPRELAGEEGRVLGEEARGRGKDMILAPGINQSGARSVEEILNMSEDPYLISELVVPMVKGNPAVGCCGVRKAFLQPTPRRQSVSGRHESVETDLRRKFIFRDFAECKGAVSMR